MRLLSPGCTDLTGILMKDHTLARETGGPKCPVDEDYDTCVRVAYELRSRGDQTVGVVNKETGRMVSEVCDWDSEKDTRASGIADFLETKWKS